MKKRPTLAVIQDELYSYPKMVRFSVKKSAYARKRIKMINGGYNGTNQEFNDIVVPYWKPYGKRPKKYWFDLYCSGEDCYDPRYIPDSMWYGTFLPYFNNILLLRAYTDKGMLDRFLPNVRQPQTVVKNTAGHYYDGSNAPISRERGIELCEAEDTLIFKPSLYSGGGRLIQFYDKTNSGQGEIERLFSEYEPGFVAQRIVSQHPDLARIHKESLNTVRIITMNFENAVHVLSAQLRMGAGASRVDNISAGGCSCPIKEDGWLADRSVTRKSEWSEEHPSGIKFKDIRVPNFGSIVRKAKELHPQMPYFNIIGWDFAVDEEGEPVLIEFNVCPEQNQIAGGPTFGELTERVLNEVFVAKTLNNKFN